MKARVAQVRRKDKLRRFQSPVSGDKIMEVCKFTPGPAVGKLKKEIEEAILDGKIPNDYQAALDYLLEIKDRLWAMPNWSSAPSPDARLNSASFCTLSDRKVQESCKRQRHPSRDIAVGIFLLLKDR